MFKNYGVHRGSVTFGFGKSILAFGYIHPLPANPEARAVMSKLSSRDLLDFGEECKFSSVDLFANLGNSQRKREKIMLQINEDKVPKKRKKEKKMAKVRKCTIDRHLLKVVREAIDLKRDLKKFRYIKHEMRPPLTSTYIHFDGLRQVHNLQRSLQYDVIQSEKNDIERKKELDEVKSTCESYRRIMLNFTNFIDQNREKRERTVRQMDENIKIIREASIEIRRLIKAAQDLLYVRDTMQNVIDENSNYVEFLNEVVSKSTRYKSIEMLVNRHESLINSRNRLIDQYFQLMTDIELAKFESMRDDYNNIMAMVSALGRLQQIDFLLTSLQNESKTASEAALTGEEREEDSETVKTTEPSKSVTATKRSILHSPVATFIQRLAEKLILAGMLDRSLHQRALPQQVEAIRSEYFRKLDIIRNYRENLEAKHRRREKKAAAEKKKEESKIGYDKQYNHLLDRVKVLDLHHQFKQKKSHHKKRARRPTVGSDGSATDAAGADGKTDDEKDGRILEDPSNVDDMAFDVFSVASTGAGSDGDSGSAGDSSSIYSSLTNKRD